MLIRYSEGGFTYCLPLRENNHDLAFALLYQVQKHWSDSQGDRSIIDELFPLIRSICLMTQTAPGLEWDFEKLKDDHAILEDFFLKPDAFFVKMHEFEPKEHAKTTKKGDFEIPPPVSGNLQADRIASYLHNTEWPPSEVENILKWLSREDLHNVIWTMTELAIPDRRIDEEKQKIVDDYGLDLEEIAQSLAFGTYDLDGEIDEMHSGTKTN